MSKVTDQLLHELNMLCETTIAIKDQALVLREMLKYIDSDSIQEIDQLKKLLAEKDLIIKRYLDAESEKCL
jgi:hypothetical protein